MAYGWQNSCRSRLCNILQFGDATFSKNILHFSPKSACKKQSEEITKTINKEYEELFKVLKDKHENKTMDSDSKSSYDNMKYNFEEDEILREMLQKVIHFSDITIEIIGNWLWISGNTYQYRKELKEFSFKFAGQKKCWYWHSEAFRKKSHKPLSMNDIRSYYGSTEVETDGRKRLEA